MSSIIIDIDDQCQQQDIPSKSAIRKWIRSALAVPKAEISVLIVDEQHSAMLNEQYRQKKGPTNILSFAFTSQTDRLLGDLVLCAPIVTQEAFAQNKRVSDHYAHLLVHGTLHLQGFDHIDVDSANIMEQKEITILAKYGIANPYEPAA